MRTTFHSNTAQPTTQKIPRPYSVKDMVKYLKKKYEINFYEISPEGLKTQAIVKKSHLIDIACDVKELLRDNGRIKYEYIGTLLEVFDKTTKDPLEQ